MRNDALSVVSQLAASSNNVFTHSQAAQLGVSHRTIADLKRSGVISEPWKGTLIWCSAPGSPTWTETLRAAVTGREAVASHLSAARLHGLDGMESVDSLHIASSHEVNVRLKGVDTFRTSTLGSFDITEIRNIRCTSLARTLCDVASIADFAVTERAFDDALRRGARPSWIRETALRMSATRNSGRRIVLGLLDDHIERGVVSGSWFERLVEDCVTRIDAQVVRQFRLCDAEGGHVATFDLAIPQVLLAIEAHSRASHFGATGEAYDERRENRAAALGWDVMYVGYADLETPKRVAAAIAQRVAIRRAQLSGAGG